MKKKHLLEMSRKDRYKWYEEWGQNMIRNEKQRVLNNIKATHGEKIAANVSVLIEDMTFDELVKKFADYSERMLSFEGDLKDCNRAYSAIQEQVIKTKQQVIDLQEALPALKQKIHQLEFENNQLVMREANRGRMS